MRFSGKGNNSGIISLVQGFETLQATVGLKYFNSIVKHVLATLDKQTTTAGGSLFGC